MISENERMANLYQRLIDGNPSTVSGNTNSPVKNKSHAKNNSIQNTPELSSYNYQLQPITTQTKIGKDKKLSQQQKKTDQDELKTNIKKKVTQIKKEKQTSEKKTDENRQKVNHLRKIVQEKQFNTNQKEQAKRSLININQTQKDNNQKKKKFINSHSQMRKNDVQNKNRTGTSVQITKKLPLLNPQVKLQKNLEQKNQQSEVRKETPSSKNSFRIKKSVNNISSPPAPMDNATLAKIKKLREQFIRLNQNQKEIQKQILQTHLQTKDNIEKMKEKYRLNFHNYDKYGIRQNHNIHSQKMQESIVTKKPSKKNLQSSIKEIQQSHVKNQDPHQKKQVNGFYQQIEKINTLLKEKAKSIKKSELKLQKNPYLIFLEEQPSDIEEEFQQQEIDSPKQQPLQTVSQKIMGNTYGSVMNQMKNKKWGLQQRITFQTHSQKSIDNSKVTKQSLNKFQKQKNNFNPILQQSQTKQAQQGNKISVNSRLKNMLFQ